MLHFAGLTDCCACAALVLPAALLAAGYPPLNADVDLEDKESGGSQRDLPAAQQPLHLRLSEGMARLQHYMNEFELAERELGVVVGEEVEMAAALPRMYPVCWTTAARSASLCRRTRVLDLFLNL